MPRMILDAGQALDEPGDSRQCPQAGPKAMCAGALAQRRIDFGHLLRRHPWLAAGPPSGSQRCTPTPLPCAKPAHDALAADTETAGDGPMRLLARSKQLRRLVATHFQSVKIPSRGIMSSHTPSYNNGPRIVTILCEIQ